MNTTLSIIGGIIAVTIITLVTIGMGNVDRLDFIFDMVQTAMIFAIFYKGIK